MTSCSSMLPLNYFWYLMSTSLTSHHLASPFSFNSPPSTPPRGIFSNLEVTTSDESPPSPFWQSPSKHFNQNTTSPTQPGRTLKIYGDNGFSQMVNNYISPHKNSSPTGSPQPSPQNETLLGPLSFLRETHEMEQLLYPLPEGSPRDVAEITSSHFPNLDSETLLVYEAVKDVQGQKPDFMLPTKTNSVLTYEVWLDQKGSEESLENAIVEKMYGHPVSSRYNLESVTALEVLKTGGSIQRYRVSFVVAD